ncbi:hypothetical protein PIB30_014681 [Stylosanthes scabra]|uniref:Uncharacterized protein n=1 Tax=Stylosanthes scabra TaxID=79078 RepID=A0ABU6T8S2_9FABA|nr:hypothetical protein [Stylosanthes scabra]
MESQAEAVKHGKEDSGTNRGRRRLLRHGRGTGRGRQRKHGAGGREGTQRDDVASGVTGHRGSGANGTAERNWRWPDVR